MGRDVAVGTAVGSLILKSVPPIACSFLSLSPNFDASVITQIASHCTLRTREMKSQCGVQYEVGPCRTLVKHLDKAGTDRMFAPRGV